MDEFDLNELLAGGKFLMCNGCQTATPFAPTVEGIRRRAAELGWTVDGVISDPDSKDYCADCSISRR